MHVWSTFKVNFVLLRCHCRSYEKTLDFDHVRKMPLLRFRTLNLNFGPVYIFMNKIVKNFTFRAKSENFTTCLPCERSLIPYLPCEQSLLPCLPREQPLLQYLPCESKSCGCSCKSVESGPSHVSSKKKQNSSEASKSIFGKIGFMAKKHTFKGPVVPPKMEMPRVKEFKTIE